MNESDDAERTRKLHSTTDAQVWAQEFVDEFTGEIVGVSQGGRLDVGTMIGWFANAMQTAVAHAMPRPDGTDLTITVHLPAPIRAVGDILHVVTLHWPNAQIDLNDPAGWNIHLHPKDEHDPGRDAGPTGEPGRDHGGTGPSGPGRVES